jgi:hypothetical protein
MLSWLWNVLVGQFCVHKWAIEKKGILAGNYEQPGSIGGDYYILRCTKCGDMQCKNFH